MASILEETKKVIGIHSEIDDFDVDLKMHINTAFFQLMQLGIGPAGGYHIQEGDEEWEEFLQGATDIFAVKSYVFVVVRLLFDRPESSYGIQALERMRDEWAWRLEVQTREREHAQISP